MDKTAVLRELRYLRYYVQVMRAQKKMTVKVVRYINSWKLIDLCDPFQRSCHILKPVHHYLAGGVMQASSVFHALWQKAAGISFKCNLRWL